MTTEQDRLKRITARPDVFGGKPIIRDMRISVELILSLLAQGVSQDTILDNHPNLETTDIRACHPYARAVIAGTRWPSPEIVQIQSAQIEPLAKL